MNCGKRSKMVVLETMKCFPMCTTTGVISNLFIFDYADAELHSLGNKGKDQVGLTTQNLLKPILLLFSVLRYTYTNNFLSLE